MSDNYEEFFDILEALNDETYKDYIDVLKKLDEAKNAKWNLKSRIRKLINLVTSKKNIQKEKNQMCDIQEKKVPILHIPHDKKIVIYTCIFGNYDVLRNPIYKYSDCKYVLFTDQVIDKESTAWEIVDIPNKVKQLNDSIYINRYLKMHPAELFPEADYVLYIDGSYRIMSDIYRLVPLLDPEVGIATHLHRCRDSNYDEAIECIRLNKGNSEKIKLQMARYKEEGFPEHYGLLELPVMLTDNSIKSQKIMDDWWKEFYFSASLRDQLSFPYVLWKNNINPSQVGVLGDKVLENRIFKHYPHGL